MLHPTFRMMFLTTYRMGLLRSASEYFNNVAHWSGLLPIRESCCSQGGRQAVSVVEFWSMDEQVAGTEGKGDRMNAELFTPKRPERDEMPVNAWAIAGLVVLVVVGILFVMGHKKPTSALNAILPLDAYAAQLPLTQIAMSESTSLSGGKSTFVDGHIGNTGTSVVTGVTVQVLFRNDEGMPPQVETLPLTLIRTHEPYVDTEPVSMAPLKPGGDQEFRLIFETLPTNWNTQVPEIHVVGVRTGN
jgi:hypothetical protein